MIDRVKQLDISTLKRSLSVLTEPPPVPLVNHLHVSFPSLGAFAVAETVAFADAFADTSNFEVAYYPPMTAWNTNAGRGYDFGLPG